MIAVNVPEEVTRKALKGRVRELTVWKRLDARATTPRP